MANYNRPVVINVFLIFQMKAPVAAKTFYNNFPQIPCKTNNQVIDFIAFNLSLHFTKKLF